MSASSEQEARAGQPPDAAALEASLAQDINKIRGMAGQLDARLKTLKERAGQSLNGTSAPGARELASRVEGLVMPRFDMESYRKGVLTARAQQGAERIKTLQGIKEQLGVYGRELSGLANKVQGEEAALSKLGGAGSTTSAAPAPAKSAARMPRVKMQAAVDLHSDTNFFTGFSTNLSDGGLFIATVELVALGTEVDLHFTLPSGQSVNAKGVVRWRREVNDATPDIFPGVGIQFVNLSPNAQQAIHQFVKSRDPLFFPD